MLSKFAILCLLLNESLWSLTLQERCTDCLNDVNRPVGYPDQDRYYRLDGECIICPNNPWILAVGAIVIITLICLAAYVLNGKSVNVGMLAIMVDYAQVRRLPSVSVALLLLPVWCLLSALSSCRSYPSSRGRKWHGHPPLLRCTAGSVRSTSTWTSPRRSAPFLT